VVPLPPEPQDMREGSRRGGLRPAASLSTLSILPPRPSPWSDPVPRPGPRSMQGLDRIAALTGALRDELSAIRGRICQQ
jgi:hypothetical protein